MIDWTIILHAGIASGTVLLFAALGEILAERSGVMNLGVEGMMLIGAMMAFSTAVSTGQPWLGVFYAMLAAGLLALLHAVVTISFQADQVVSGLAVNFLGIGLSMVLGEGLSKAGAVSLLPIWTIPGLSLIPIIGPILFTAHSPLVYLGYLATPAVWYYINRTRPGLHLRAVGEYPSAADALGINVYRLRYLYVFVGGLMAGLAGATISLAVSPGWFSELTTGGQGWIAVGLGDLRPVEPVARGRGRLHVRRAAPVDPRPAGADDAVVVQESLFLHAPTRLLPADVALRAGHHHPGDRLARGHEEAHGRAGRAGQSVCARGARVVTQPCVT